VYEDAASTRKLLYVMDGAVRAFDYERDQEEVNGDVMERMENAHTTPIDTDDEPGVSTAVAATGAADAASRRLLTAPPCIVAGAGGTTQIDIEVCQRAKTHAVKRIAASFVEIDVTGPAHACDAELVAFLADTLGVRLAQMSLTRGHKQTSRVLLVKGTDPKSAYAALRRVMEMERAKVEKLAKAGL
jgi:uncharacterized protein YggU (UPF0235/DUF167 family)